MNRCSKCYSQFSAKLWSKFVLAYWAGIFFCCGKMLLSYIIVRLIIISLSAQHVNVDTNALKSPLGKDFNLYNSIDNYVTLKLLIDINDAGDVEEILQGTDIDKICEVGLALGLSMKSIRKLRFTEEMVSAWLQRKDDVEATTGTPSWESLESALQKEGLSGASEMIVKS